MNRRTFFGGLLGLPVTAAVATTTEAAKDKLFIITLRQECDPTNEELERFGKKFFEATGCYPLVLTGAVEKLEVIGEQCKISEWKGDYHSEVIGRTPEETKDMYRAMMAERCP